MPQLFITRTTDPLDWLSEVPASWGVTVHDLRGDLERKPLPRAVTLVQVPGRRLAPQGSTGSVAAACLRHLASAHVADPLDLTVFSPQDPLAHSPDFLDLLLQTHAWGDVQPLSTIGSRERAVPPPALLAHDCRDHIGKLAVRAERFGLCTGQPLPYLDPLALGQAQAYRHRHGLPEGSNLVAHFLARSGLPDLARQAAAADVGLMAHGGLFAVRHRRLLALQQRSGQALAQWADRLQAAAPGAGQAGDEAMLGLLWLHLLGEPFVCFETLARPAPAKEPNGKAMARVVASIDAVLAQSTRVQPGRTMAGAEAAPPDAQAQRQRRHLARHSDAASRAWRAGDLDSAVRHAREALRLDIRTSASAYVLGMALARQNERAEAQLWLHAVTQDDTHQRFRKERRDLADAAGRELARLSLLPGALAPSTQAEQATHAPSTPPATQRATALAAGAEAGATAVATAGTAAGAPASTAAGFAAGMAAKAWAEMSGARWREMA